MKKERRLDIKMNSNKRAIIYDSLQAIANTREKKFIDIVIEALEKYIGEYYEFPKVTKGKKEVVKMQGTSEVPGTQLPGFRGEFMRVYTDWYQDQFQTPYIWKQKDNKALGGVLAQIKQKVKDSMNLDAGHVPAKEVLNAWRYILHNLPAWYIENNCEMVTINSNFNSIIQNIVNEKRKTKSLTSELERNGYTDL